ncbi:MAG: DUF6161 domain-containing protein [Labrys sp. (in: a-proteobacteria)]
MSSENAEKESFIASRSALLALRKGQVVDFNPRQKAEASHLAREQHPRWSSLMSAAASALDSQTINLMNGPSIINAFAGSEVVTHADKLEVRSKIVLLEEIDPILLEKLKNDARFVAGFLLYHLGEFIAFQQSSMSADRIKLIVDYVSYVTLQDSMKYYNFSIDLLLNDSKNSILKTNDAVNRADQLANQISKRLNDLEVSVNNKINSSDGLIDQVIVANKEKFQVALKAIDETIKSRLNFTSASNLWTQRSKEARLSANILLGFFFVVLTSSLAYVFFHHDQFIDNIKASDPNLYYYSVSLYILLFVGIGWLLRTLLKIGFRSRHLAEEADHRRSLIETFIALTNENSASLKESDRFLILISIFRPLYPVAGDDISPPTTIDLLKEAMQGQDKRP